MDDIQTLLYLIIAVIYVLARVLRKRKPRVPPQDQADTDLPPVVKQKPKQKPVSFEDILKELTGESKKEPRPKQEEPPIEMEKVKEPQTTKHFLDEDIEESYQEAVKKAEKVKPRKIETVPEGISKSPLKSVHFVAYEVEEVKENPLAKEIVKMLKDPEDVKKAIVLREILDRKY